MATLSLKNINPLSNSDVVITSPELGNTIYWTQFSGIKVNYKRPTFSDGLSNVTRTAEGGIKEFQPVTLSKPFDPDTDGEVLKKLNEYQGGKKFTLTLTPRKYLVSNSGQTTQSATKSWQLYGCTLTNVNWGDGIDTSDGSKTVMLTVEFAVEGSDLIDTPTTTQQ